MATKLSLLSIGRAKINKDVTLRKQYQSLARISKKTADQFAIYIGQGNTIKAEALYNSKMKGPKSHAVSQKDVVSQSRLEKTLSLMSNVAAWNEIRKAKKRQGTAQLQSSKVSSDGLSITPESGQVLQQLITGETGTSRISPVSISVERKKPAISPALITPVILLLGITITTFLLTRKGGPGLATVKK